MIPQNHFETAPFPYRRENMHSFNLGFIGFLDENSPDFWEDLKKVRELGYCGMEHASFFMDQAGMQRMKEMGMSAITVLPEMEELKDGKIGAYIAKAHEIGVDSISLHSCSLVESFSGKMSDFDVFKSEVDLMQECAEKAKTEGLVFKYHNHFQEFTANFSGMSAFEYMMRNTDDVMLELDIGWAFRGGVNPVHVMKEWPHRMHTLHLKDYRIAPLRRAYVDSMLLAFCTLGNGVVNVEECLEEAKKLELGWLIVEMDSLNRLNAIESLASCYYNIKEMGYL